MPADRGDGECVSRSFEAAWVFPEPVPSVCRLLASPFLRAAATAFLRSGGVILSVVLLSARWSARCLSRSSIIEGTASPKPCSSACQYLPNLKLTTRTVARSMSPWRRCNRRETSISACGYPPQTKWESLQWLGVLIFSPPDHGLQYPPSIGDRRPYSYTVTKLGRSRSVEVDFGLANSNSRETLSGHHAYPRTISTEPGEEVMAKAYVQAYSIAALTSVHRPEANLTQPTIVPSEGAEAARIRFQSGATTLEIPLSAATLLDPRTLLLSLSDDEIRGVLQE